MRRNFYIFLTLAYAFLIFILSSFPKLPTVEKPGIDKVEHVIEYSILSFLLINCFRKKNRRVVFIIILLVSLYGITDEFHQYFVPGRSCSGFDMLADSIGSFVGVWINIRFKRNHKRKF